jgi:serine/threonine protein kinase
MLKGEKLGEGTYGIVYTGTSPNTGRHYAIKRNLAEKAVSFMGAPRELDVLNRLRDHPHIVRLEKVAYGAPFQTGCFSPLGNMVHGTQRDDSIHFVFGKAHYDLHQFIYGATRIDFSLIKRYMVHMLLGLEYIHAKKIVHRDLKPSNVLIFGEDKDAQGVANVAKICDFGLSKPYTYQGRQTPNTVTSIYRAPEITLDYPHYDYKVDVWSVGCIMFEMVAKKTFIPIVPDKNDEILSAILASLPVELPMREFRELVRSNKWRRVVLSKNHKPRSRKSFQEQLGLTPLALNQFRREAGSIDKFIDLLTNMLRFEWDKRFSISQALNHTFFDDSRDIIESTRSKYSLAHSQEYMYEVRNCVERKWMASVATSIFNDRPSLNWYSHRVLFQAMDLFDRYIFAMYRAGGFPDNAMESEDKGLVHDKYGAELRFYCCVYLCIKYFTTIHHPVSFTAIVPPEYRTPESLIIAEQFESSFVVHCLDYEIYRDTVYEIADKKSDYLSETNIRDLIMIYSMNDSYTGWTPTQLYQYYINNIQGKPLDAIFKLIRTPFVN